MDKFQLATKLTPKGDQPEAIEALTKGILKGEKNQTLLGITGCGKTFIMANVIQNLQKPTLVIAHNKTLAAQLCSELREFFPNNAVSYFVSYYDYYQPEAYIPHTDTYIEKDASINEEIEKFRHAATVNLLSRRDTIVVASVSCIYGLGSIEEYENLSLKIKKGGSYAREKILRQLTDMQYKRCAMEFKQGMFHVLGDTLEIFSPDRDSFYRLEFFGDDLEKITEVDSFTHDDLQELDAVKLFPAKHDVTSREKILKAVDLIKADLGKRYNELKKLGKNLEAERIKTRTEYDMEILLETGYCSGIENYTRYLNLKKPGDPPTVLLNYFPDDFLLVIDESHMTVPQLHAMYNGNFSRKQVLIDYGFRLPSSHDNRPLKFQEFEKYMNRTVYMSATPAGYELEKSGKKNVVEVIVRPTGLIDPEVEVRPIKHQIDDILNEIHKRVKNKERALITTLTKRSAEDLTEFLIDAGVNVKYLHSDVETLDRIEILRDLRLGKIDVVVGINLLREGLDLPEVSFIAILDADKEGFLRSGTALIQTIGRASRNVNGKVIMYADRITDSMKYAIDITNKRRKLQVEYNRIHGITPKTIIKAVKDIASQHKKAEIKGFDLKKIPKNEIGRLIDSLTGQMNLAAENMEFEKAGALRDRIKEIKEYFGIT